MNDSFIPMTEAFRKKYYPKGYFAAMASKSKGGGPILIICGLILALMGGGIDYMAIACAIDMIRGELKNDMGTMIFLGIIGLLFLAPGVFFGWLGIKRSMMGADGWIRKSAGISQYPEEVIRDFDRQATMPDSILFQLASSHGSGVLTADYIGSEEILKPCVIKRSEITGAYLVHLPGMSASPGGGNLNIMICSNHNTSFLLETTQANAMQLISLLQEKTPNIDTAEGRILTDVECDARVKQRNRA